MTTVAAALAAAREKLPASEARLLLGHVLRRDTGWLIAHDDHALDEDGLLAFASLVARRSAGEPIAYLLKIREFYGRDFTVSPAVLIPRPETELLVDVVRNEVMRVGTDAAGETTRILDLGTGSGCIAITLALECPRAAVTAVDCSAAALEVAARNAATLGAKVRFLQSDWFLALAGERFDVIVGNPPYIAAGDPHLARGDLRHEPARALASGADGLDAIRHIIAAAPEYLASNGSLWMEHGYDQAEAIAELLAASGFTSIEQHRDLAGIVRVSGGRRPRGAEQHKRL